MDSVQTAEIAVQCNLFEREVSIFDLLCDKDIAIAVVACQDGFTVFDLESPDLKLFVLVFVSMACNGIYQPIAVGIITEELDSVCHSVLGEDWTPAVPFLGAVAVSQSVLNLLC